jgi:hypothetical protein
MKKEIAHYLNHAQQEGQELRSQETGKGVGGDEIGRNGFQIPLQGNNSGFIVSQCVVYFKKRNRKRALFRLPRKKDTYLKKWLCYIYNFIITQCV